MQTKTNRNTERGGGGADTDGQTEGRMAMQT